jgi:hypothetical protein
VDAQAQISLQKMLKHIEVAYAMLARSPACLQYKRMMFTQKCPLLLWTPIPPSSQTATPLEYSSTRIATTAKLKFFFLHITFSIFEFCMTSRTLVGMFWRFAMFIAIWHLIHSFLTSKNYAQDFMIYIE